MEIIKDKTEIIINNMKALSISYVDINKKYFLYYKEKFSSAQENPNIFVEILSKKSGFVQTFLNSLEIYFLR